MNKKWNGIERRQLLRAEAEKMVGSFSEGTNALNTTEMLLHELLVHKVELETQMKNCEGRMPKWKKRAIAMWISMNLLQSATSPSTGTA